MLPNLVLAGFMGTGKTTIGALLAGRLGRPFIDTDGLVEQEAGMTISDIFATQGEPAFRALERQACKKAASYAGLVIGTGGGALLDSENRHALEQSGIIVLLTCGCDALVNRLRESAVRGERPLLGSDRPARVAELLNAREPVYSSIPLRVDTTRLAPAEVANEVLALYTQAVREGSGVRCQSSPDTHHLAPDPQPPVPLRCLTVDSPEGSYSIILGRNLLLGALAEQEGLGRRVVVATDTNVAPLYSASVLSSLKSYGFEPSLAIMPAGEQHKNQGSVDLFVDSFLEAGLDRTGWALALGGGVVGDTAGFAASIYMRGVPLVQAPTTLLAMADSSIGGKVGIDHPRGKNLLGAFKQPRLVVVNLDTLDTLPSEQIACGMAEIIKAGIIADPALFDLIERSDPRSLDYERVLLAAMEVKRGIVERDPHEAGERALLNLGHTFGHAFEKCTGYARLHGYAVAQGMVAAFRLAELLDMCDASARGRLEVVLEKWGLPVRWGQPHLSHNSAIEEVWAAMAADKKRKDGQLRFVLPHAIGSVRLVEGVPESTVKRVLTELQ